MFQENKWVGNTEGGSLVGIQSTRGLENGLISSSNPKFSYEEEIQDYNSFTKSALSWSSLKSVANAKIMTFVDNKKARNCFGFYMTGGNAYRGAAYSVRGLFCRPSPQAAQFSDDDIAAFLRKIVVSS